MLNQRYKKALYQLASTKKKETGIHRSFLKPCITDSLNYPCYVIIREAENITLEDAAILPHLIGDETELLTKKCLNSYWSWLILRNACIKEGDTPIARAINEVRSNALVTFGESLYTPIQYLKPEHIAKFVAHGFLLWNDAKNEIVQNPIFF